MFGSLLRVTIGVAIAQGVQRGERYQGRKSAKTEALDNQGCIQISVGERLGNILEGFLFYIEGVFKLPSDLDSAFGNADALSDIL